MCKFIFVRFGRIEDAVVSEFATIAKSLDLLISAFESGKVSPKTAYISAGYLKRRFSTLCTRLCGALDAARRLSGSDALYISHPFYVIRYNTIVSGLEYFGL